MRKLQVTDSSNIAAVAYDPITQKLRVEFKGGREYDYHEVSPDVFAGFVAAPSIGEFHAHVLKARFNCTRVVPELPAGAPKPDSR